MRKFERVNFTPCRPAWGGFHMDFPLAFGVSWGCLGGRGRDAATLTPVAEAKRV